MNQISCIRERERYRGILVKVREELSSVSDDGFDIVGEFKNQEVIENAEANNFTETTELAEMGIDDSTNPRMNYQPSILAEDSVPLNSTLNEKVSMPLYITNDGELISPNLHSHDGVGIFIHMMELVQENGVGFMVIH